MNSWIQVSSITSMTPTLLTTQQPRQTWWVSEPSERQPNYDNSYSLSGPVKVDLEGIRISTIIPENDVMRETRFEPWAIGSWRHWLIRPERTLATSLKTRSDEKVPSRWLNFQERRDHQTTSRPRPQPVESPPTFSSHPAIQMNSQMSEWNQPTPSEVVIYSTKRTNVFTQPPFP